MIYEISFADYHQLHRGVIMSETQLSPTRWVLRHCRTMRRIF